LEDINNILNSGEVPNLFEKDELEQVLAATRPKAREAGISEENRDEVCTEIITYSAVESFQTVKVLHSICYMYNMYNQTD